MATRLEVIEHKFMAYLESRKEDLAQRKYHPFGVMNSAAHVHVPFDLKTLQEIYRECPDLLDKNVVRDQLTDSYGYHVCKQPNYVLVRGLRWKVISYLYRRGWRWIMTECHLRMG